MYFQALLIWEKRKEINQNNWLVYGWFSSMFLWLKGTVRIQQAQPAPRCWEGSRLSWTTLQRPLWQSAGMHLGQPISTLIYSMGIKLRTRRFPPPSEAPVEVLGGGHHPQVIPREMGWEWSQRPFRNTQQGRPVMVRRVSYSQTGWAFGTVWGINLFLLLFIAAFLVTQSWLAHLQLRQWLPCAMQSGLWSFSCPRSWTLSCCGSCARGYSITQDTVKESFTAATKNTTLACSLQNRRANPINPLLNKTPEDRTHICCSWNYHHPLYFERLQR